MATSLQSFIDRTRRYMRDWQDQDALTASVASGGTTLSVADSSLYFVNEPIEIEQEEIIVRALPSGTTLTVKRGAFGSTAASHANGTTVLIKPRFLQLEIIDALNAGIDACFPLLYRPVVDESITFSTSTYEYNVPNMVSPAIPIPRIRRLSVKDTGDTAFREFKHWDIIRGTTPKIKLRRLPSSAGTLRIEGYGPFPHLSLLADTTDSLWPYNADRLLPLFAASELLGSGEALRVRTDTGAIDTREQATRVGASSAEANRLEARFQRALLAVAMPPMQPTIKTII
jgi:hypothetical protein